MDKSVGTNKLELRKYFSRAFISSVSSVPPSAFWHLPSTVQRAMPQFQRGRQSERTKHKFDLWSPTKGTRSEGPQLKRETNKFPERATQQTDEPRKPTEDITTVINSAPMTNGDLSSDKTELLYHDSLRFRNL